jgi:hypothetical protein
VEFRRPFGQQAQPCLFSALAFLWKWRYETAGVGMAFGYYEIDVVCLFQRDARGAQ